MLSRKLIIVNSSLLTPSLANSSLLMTSSSCTFTTMRSQGNFYNMKSTGKSNNSNARSERTTTSSFDGTSTDARKKADEERTKHDNFFKRRDDETEHAARDPRSFRQQQGTALRWTQHASNVFFLVFGTSTFICIFAFQYIYSNGFGTGLEAWLGTHRKNYWTKRNEAVDTKLHRHSSFSEMMGFRRTNVTNKGDDEILARAKEFMAKKKAAQEVHTD